MTAEQYAASMELLIRTSNIFYEKLQAKTSWGRVEIKELYIQAKDEAIQSLNKDILK